MIESDPGDPVLVEGESGTVYESVPATTSVEDGGADVLEPGDTTFVVPSVGE